MKAKLSSKKARSIPVKKKSTAIFSFFAGAGFLDLGFEKSGFDTVFVNEYYKPFLEAYKHARKVIGISEPRFGYSPVDIKTLTKPKASKELKSIVARARKLSDVIGFIGGPPCPDFSIGGKNRGHEGDNGVLSKVYIDIIVKQQPDFFLFENVKGLWSTKRHREFYDSLKRKLEKSGYVLTDKLINSIEYGAPQDRNRVILIGFHREFLNQQGLPRSMNKFPWHLGKMYERSVLKEEWPSTNVYKANSKTPRPKMIKEDLTISHWFSKNSIITHSNANDFFKPRAALSRFKSIPEGDVSKKSFKRLHRWRYSPTAAYGNNEVHIHPFLPRRISVAEALAIQSLPRDYELPETMTLSDKFKAVGNGVPYVAAKGVAKAIRSFID